MRRRCKPAARESPARLRYTTQKIGTESSEFVTKALEISMIVTEAAEVGSESVNMFAHAVKITTEVA